MVQETQSYAMSSIKEFEDLIIWQDARLLCKELYPVITREGYSFFPKLKNQIEGSSRSIPDNIAEGFERGGNKESFNFFILPKDRVEN